MFAKALIHKKPRNQIYVSCGTPFAGMNSTSIRFTLANRDPDADTILLTFDNEPPQQYWFSNGMIGSSGGRRRQLRARHREVPGQGWVNVRFADGTNATFSLKGANRATGAHPAASRS